MSTETTVRPTPDPKKLGATLFNLGEELDRIAWLLAHTSTELGGEERSPYYFELEKEGRRLWEEIKTTLGAAWIADRDTKRAQQ